MLARKLSSLGRMRCPRAWRAKKATLRPSSTPQTYASEGAPNGVFTRTSFPLVSPGIEYRPLPPIIPISAWATHPPKRARCQKSSARVVQTRDYIKLILRHLLAASGGPAAHYNLPMRFATALVALTLLVASAFAQNGSKVDPRPRPVTVPVTLDHNRVVVDVYLPLPDGSTKRVRGWIDNGDTEVWMSRRAATLMGLVVTCDDKECSALPPAAITMGEMKIPLSGVNKFKIPLKPPSAAAVMAAGMSAEIKIPSSVLRNYDVLVNFPDREFSIGLAGSLKFKGVKSKM